jgi:hypothetical protein
MVIASWLVGLDAEKVQAACRALAAPGRDVRSKSGSRWLVLVTETPQSLEDVRRDLLETPGVESVDPIASFDDDAPGLDLTRWQPAPDRGASVAQQPTATANSAAGVAGTAIARR